MKFLSPTLLPALHGSVTWPVGKGGEQLQASSHPHSVVPVSAHLLEVVPASHSSQPHADPAVLGLSGRAFGCPAHGKEENVLRASGDSSQQAVVERGGFVS